MMIKSFNLLSVCLITINLKNLLLNNSVAVQRQSSKSIKLHLHVKVFFSFFLLNSTTMLSCLCLIVKGDKRTAEPPTQFSCIVKSSKSDARGRSYLIHGAFLF